MRSHKAYYSHVAESPCISLHISSSESCFFFRRRRPGPLSWRKSEFNLIAKTGAWDWPLFLLHLGLFFNHERYVKPFSAPGISRYFHALWISNYTLERFCYSVICCSSLLDLKYQDQFADTIRPLKQPNRFQRVFSGVEPSASLSWRACFLNKLSGGSESTNLSEYSRIRCESRKDVRT